MNRFILTGEIKAVKFLDDSVLVYVEDMERGYRRSDGVVVDDMFFTWKVVFANNFKNFIVKFFNDGMMVDIDAKMRPFAIEKGVSEKGYSCLGIAIQRSNYVKKYAKAERKMIAKSQIDGNDTPDFASYNEPDF